MFGEKPPTFIDDGTKLSAISTAAPDVAAAAAAETRVTLGAISKSSVVFACSSKDTFPCCVYRREREMEERNKGKVSRDGKTRREGGKGREKGKRQHVSMQLGL